MTELKTMELIINTKDWHSSQSFKFLTCLFKAKFLLCNISSNIIDACFVTKHFADEENVEHSCSYMPLLPNPVKTVIQISLTFRF